MGRSLLTFISLFYQQILERLSNLCVSHGASGKKNRKHEQRLLRNMGAHTVVLELLQIPYDKVNNMHLAWRESHSSVRTVTDTI